MPTAALHPCLPGCPNLVPRGKARCPDHERQRERQRGSAAERGYGPEWRRYREQYLKEHPLCVIHLGRGEVVPATVVDHKKAHKGDSVLFWDPSNHRATCKPCHDNRTDEGDFGR